MQVQELIQRAIQIREKYDALNQQKYGGKWDAPELMAGFVGDVGDLSKIIMAKSGRRGMEDIDKKLTHELSDCLWSVINIASKYNIDLEAEFMKTMDELDERIDKELAA
ncbi:MAG: hypothetical protein JWS12_6 [Candidatus Saccharibacteria bacterium]|nr:hypothetical protein [Candidatus Saccharibacteria bacterium]